MKPTTPSILTVNGGSFSIKFALFDRVLSYAVEKEGNYEKAKH